MAERSIILGISCYYHDAAAALLVDGKAVAAAQEERFTREKHDERFPEHGVRFCLESQGFSVRDLTHVVFYDKPVLKFERILRTAIARWPRGPASFVSAMRVWLKDKLWIEQKIKKELGWAGPVHFAEHHYAHAASAYYASAFGEAAVVTMDGVGEWDTTAIGRGEGSALHLSRTVRFPHSLGLLYSALTYYLGFRVNSAEYKVMGLAPYGDPEAFAPQFRELVEAREDGSFRLNMRYFAYEYGSRMTNRAFDRLFGAPPRSPESALTQRDKDIAAALQQTTEDIVLKIVREAKRRHPSDNLCLAGGVALNCVANGKILAEGLYKHIYVQPAAGDAGGALGAAAYLHYGALGHEKRGSVMPSAYLGPAFSADECAAFLDSKGAQYERLVGGALPERVASLIADENAVVGWFDGRMEFGPRALGARSILADARNKENWRRVNLKIKFRESFRPFAPAVLAERADEYFALRGHASPHMLLVAPVLRPNEIPAVTHVDGSARVQTVSREDNPRFHALLKAFEARTGCPVLVNTSFNVRSEPIVCTPEDAWQCFANTDMDYLVLGDILVSKAANPALGGPKDLAAYLGKFALD